MSFQTNYDSRDILAEMKNITKVYPPNIVALRGVDFYVRKGEIVALLGENGAGKTTLMKILSGVIKPTSGKIYYQGKEVEFSSPHDALKLGIGMVHQLLSIIPQLTVAENILLPMDFDILSSLKIDFETLATKIKKFSEEIGLPINPYDIAANLPAGLKQRVEILKLLLRGINILILDEPTSLLTPLEAERLLQFLVNMRNQGKTVIYVTHKVHEVKRIADRAVVLAKGKFVAEINDPKNIDVEVLTRLMLNEQEFFRSTDSYKIRQHFTNGNTLLEIRDLYVEDEDNRPVLKGVNLVIKEGEILGLAGIVNNGQTELVEAILGVRKIKRGTILLKGIDLTKIPTDKRVSLISYIPDERILHGVAAELPLTINAVIKDLNTFCKCKILVDNKRVLEFTETLIKTFDVKTPAVNSLTKNLSGGNIQRFIIGRELMRNPELLLAVQPTAGLDVKATMDVHRRLLELREKGRGILLVSYDLDELLKLSDRIAVIYGGRIVKSYDSINEVKIEELGKLMLTGTA